MGRSLKPWGNRGGRGKLVGRCIKIKTLQFLVIELWIETADWRPILGSEDGEGSEESLGQRV